MLDLRVAAPDTGRLISELAATDAQARRALSATVRKMAGWVRARSTKGLSKELQLQQKIIRRRLKTARVRKTANGIEVVLWYGLDPVALIYLQAKQRSTGVSAAGRFVKGAFIAGTPAGGKQVFKRAGAARLPLEKQQADVHHQAEDYLEHQAFGAQFEAQFYKTFEHEMKWQTR